MLRIRQKLVQQFGRAVYIGPSAEISNVNLGKALDGQNASDIRSILGSLPENGPTEFCDDHVFNGGNKSRAVEKFDL